MGVPASLRSALRMPNADNDDIAGLAIGRVPTPGFFGVTANRSPL